jgi:hypothetical protein
LPEGTLAGLAALKWPTAADVTSTTGKQKVDLGSTQPLGILAQELANSALAGKDVVDVSKPDNARQGASEPDLLQTQSLELPADLLPQRHILEPVTPPASQPPAAEAPIANGSMTEFGELTLLATGEWQAMQRSDRKSEAKPEPKAEANDLAGTKPEVKAQASQSAELSGAETLSLISKSAPAADKPATEPTLQLAARPSSEVEPKRAVNGE